MHQIYNSKSENIKIINSEYDGLPSNISSYKIAYIGKHKAISPLDVKELTEEDFDPSLLIECRLFNDEEEIFVFPRNGVVQQRQIVKGVEIINFVDKTIQLRSKKGSNDRNVLVMRHYFDGNGYNIQRYLKVN